MGPQTKEISKEDVKNSFLLFVFSFFLFPPTDSDVSVVAAAPRLPQRPLQPPGAAGDRAQLVRDPLVPHCVRLSLPARLRGQSLW